MTHNEVIDKLAKEMILITGETDHLNTYRWFIRQALVIGVEHYTKEMEEIIAMDKWGGEQGRFKGVRDASEKLGIPRGNIYQVLEGRRPSAGGFRFIRNRDKYLIKN